LAAKIAPDRQHRPGGKPAACSEVLQETPQRAVFAPRGSPAVRGFFEMIQCGMERRRPGTANFRFRPKATDVHP